MSQTEAVIYHNPRCSKSRKTLSLLQENNIKIHIIEYLNTPLDQKELKSLCAKLKMQPENLIRKGESIFKELYRDHNLSDGEWISTMVKHPILIERPIVVVGQRAVLGRPPENVLELINQD